MKIKKIKVGILGLGRAGRGMHYKEILNCNADYFDIVAACDCDQKQIEKTKNEFPDLNTKYYTKFEEMLADKNVELVAVATRSLDHVKHALQAAKAGKIVFVEKPVTPSVREFDKLIVWEKKHPGTIFIRHNRRFEPCFNHILDILKTGKLGWVYEIKLARNNYSWRADWQTLIEYGGGQLLNWGPHIIDHSLQLLQSPVKSVWSNLKLVAAKGDAEDHIKIVFTGENGRIVDMEISGGVAISEPVYIIHGTKGSLVSQDEKRIRIKYQNPAIPTPVFSSDPGTPDGFGAPFTPEWIEDDLQVAPSIGCQTNTIWKDLYFAIRENKPFRITLEEAREVVRITELVKAGGIDNARDHKC
ncbi:MAG: Gfo/Idh/MocA family protein [Victivallales bacterium]